MAIKFYQFSLTKELPFSITFEEESIRISDILDRVDQDYPYNLNERVRDATDPSKTDEHVFFAVNGSRITDLNLIAKDGDEVTVAPLLAGG